MSIKGVKWGYLPILFLVSMLYTAGCSPESTSPVSTSYHNLASHYNGYFYARESIRGIENQIRESIENDYDRILPLFPAIDTTLAKSYEDQIEESIKMASLAIQRHPNSKWEDDSYLLVGLARQYSLDYPNAITTYKYINTNSEDDDTKHRALIYLMKAFTDYGELSNAVAVSDYLKKEPLNEDNMKLLYLYRAYYYQVTGDLDNMLTNLVNAAPILSNKDGKGRLYFIIGQNYQELGFEAEAYNYYKKCISTNPEYELDFHARLKMAQVTQLGKNSDIRNARKLFKKLLDDKKNLEFRDKIFYEMAEFEMRNRNMDLAVQYYNSSIRESTNNRKVKGQSYLRLGEINYDSLRDFRTAKLYYDSTISTLPKDVEGYEAIANRQKVLADFVANLTIIEVNDSLLTLSKMDTGALRKYLTEFVETKRAQEEEKEKNRRTSSSTSVNNSVFNTSVSTGTSSWYFDNLTAVAIGETEFRRVWGDLKLEDNWRRSVKESQVSINNPAAIQGGPEDIIAPSEIEVTSVKDEVSRLVATVPYDSASRSKALEEIEDAYYNLGNIYHFNLEEEPNAAESFETLLSRFEETEYQAEVMYLLYLIYGELNPDRALYYRTKILNDHPNTTYAKLVINPNYTKESSEAAEKLKVLYDEAYGYYGTGDFVNARRLISAALTEYDDLQISTRFKLLEVLITGKTEDINQYQYELGEFIKANPDSDLREYAEELLAASREFQDKMLRARGVKFIEYFEQEHFVILAYPSSRRLTNSISETIETFNKKNYPNQELKYSNLILNSDTHITMITQFPGAKSSLLYYEKFTLDPEVAEALPLKEMEVFTITKDNFSIFYQTKELNGYLTFFKDHY